MKIENFRKILKYKIFMKIRRVGGGEFFYADRRTDGRTIGRPNNKRKDRRTGMKKLTFPFYNIANVSLKKVQTPLLMDYV
jgi:hypothetical protein